MSKTSGAVAVAYKDYQRALHDNSIAQKVMEQTESRVEMIGSVVAEMMFKEQDIIVGTVLNNAGYLNKGNWVVAAFQYRGGLFAAISGKPNFENAGAYCFNMRKDGTVGKRTCTFRGRAFESGGLALADGKKFADLTIKRQPDKEGGENIGETQGCQNPAG